MLNIKLMSKQFKRKHRLMPRVITNLLFSYVTVAKTGNKRN